MSQTNLKLVLNLKFKENQVKFGNDVKKLFFDLDQSVIFINHGSYGAVPKIISQKRRELQLIQEKNPDDWFRYTSNGIWTKNLFYLAGFLNVPQENLVFCFNATDSINSIMKSIKFQGKQDAILFTNLTYGAIQNTIDYVSNYRFDDQNRVQKIQLNIKFPILTTADLVQQFDDLCKEIIQNKNLKLKLVVLDQISSGVPILFPLKEICQVIRNWSTQSNSDTIILIDGAHGIGHLELNLSNLDCDFYVSNLHKWFLAPRGCTFLYFKDKIKAQKYLEPNYISAGYQNKPDVSYNYFARGTKDNTSWYCIQECINFHVQVLGGYQKIYRYNTDLLDKAVDMLVINWKTSKFNLAKELEAPFMRLVKLPKMKNYSFADGAKLMKDVLQIYKIVSVFVNIQGELYCRLSCYVYNDINDFIALKDAILDLNK